MVDLGAVVDVLGSGSVGGVVVSVVHKFTRLQICTPNPFFLLFFAFFSHLTHPRDAFHSCVGIVASFHSFVVLYY
jgi:hypothetical protein